MRRFWIGVAGAFGVMAVGTAGWWTTWGAAPPPVVIVSDPALPGPAAREGLPDVLLLIGCTLRKDQLTVYGGPSNTTPRLASFAAEGALFTDTIASAPWTKAASTAILTGYDAVSVGMVEPRATRNHRALQPVVTTLAEHLRAAGYHTVGATANPNLNAIFGFEQGFDAYVQPEGLWRNEMTKLSVDGLLPSLGRLVADAPDERPLYAQVLLVDAHAPFEGLTHSPKDFAEPAPPDAVAGEVRAYRAALRGFDDAAAAVMEATRRRGRDPLVLIVSDHGEGLRWPEHHGKAHGRFLAPSAVGALWAMRGPGVGRGVRIDGVTSQVDIVPTLLGVLGLEGYAGPGMDHSALLARGGRSTRQAAFTDTWFIDTSRAAVYTEARACQRDFARVDLGEVGLFREGCFDRGRDPRHDRPLPNAALEGTLLAWREARVEEMRLFSGGNAEVTDDVQRQLEALGYLDRR